MNDNACDECGEPLCGLSDEKARSEGWSITDEFGRTHRCCPACRGYATASRRAIEDSGSYPPPKE